MAGTASGGLWLPLGRFAAFFLGGGLVLGCSLYLLSNLFAPWATTSGEIIGTTVSTWSSVSTGSRSDRPPSYEAAISYDYEVAGREYTGSGLRYGMNPMFNSPADAWAAMAPFPYGSRVTVHYNPNDPERSALIVGTFIRPAWILLGVGVALVGFGFWLGRIQRRL